MSSEPDDTLTTDDADLEHMAAHRQLEAGDLFADRYEVQAKIGEGGMGAVYRVRDRKLEEVIALKTLTLESEEAVLRFRDEVRLARRVTHPNVARTHDMGLHASVHFLTMEHVSGRGLDAHLEECGPLDLAAVFRIGIEVAKGLSAAHAAGVVHRDLKPANIMLADDGRAVLTDFGIARATTEAGSETGALLGTPAYMAPEQVRGEPIDARADVYSLGLILYELATGTLPFVGESALAVALARVMSPPTDPREHVANLPEAFANLVLRCLALTRSERPSSAADVRAALEGLSSPGVRTQTDLTTGTELYAPLAPGDRTLAILPFLYRGADEHEYLGEGLAEELIDVLSRTRGLKVLALGATRRFADTRDPKQLRAELAVHAVVDGTVQRSGDRVRVAARLVETQRGVQQWNGRFEGRYEDVFEIQEKLGQRIAEQLRVELGATSNTATPPEAVELYLRARRILRRGLLMGSGDAVEHLDQALTLAPDLAVAKAAHAVATVRAWWGPILVQNEGQGERARRSVARALAEAPELAETHLTEAMLAVQVGAFPKAAKALGRALEIAPTMPEAHAYLGGLQLEAGRRSEGIERLRGALEIDPSIHSCHIGLARAMLEEGDLEQHAHHDSALAEAVPPQYFPVLVARFRWALYRGATSDARAHLAVVRSLGTVYSTRFDQLASIAVGEGDLGAASQVSGQLVSWFTNSRSRALLLQIAAEVFAAAGQDTFALDAVERAVAANFIDVAWLRSCPLFEDIREAPRFLDAIRTTDMRARAVWQR